MFLCVWLLRFLVLPGTTLPVRTAQVFNMGEERRRSAFHSASTSGASPGLEDDGVTDHPLISRIYSRSNTRITSSRAGSSGTGLREREREGPGPGSRVRRGNAERRPALPGGRKTNGCGHRLRRGRKQRGTVLRTEEQ
ncbi:unnamed protein product [Pleuronectes platessa]|uniref:Secreted protein n=1 Tax=Pleuronectes platessa TaxID=8262 RepID=A0A9N7YJ88_PLEPL|nr:unnamed protein product [Pleuronectes platessa]